MMDIGEVEQSSVSPRLFIPACMRLTAWSGVNP
jgi:hypothetical protein